MSNPTEKTASAPTIPHRDLVFTHYATCIIAAAVLPVPAHHMDHAAAEVTAAACARILDGGGAPKDYVIRRYARMFDDIAQADAVAEGAKGPVIQNGRIVNAAEGAAFRKKIEAAGPLPRREVVNSDNAAALARISDISEPVRSAAMHASVARLTVSREGVRELDAVAIVIEEIERAIRVADSLGLDSKGIGERKEGTVKEAIESVPYPGNVALFLSIEIMDSVGGSGHEDGSQDPDHKLNCDDPPAVMA